MISRFNKIIIIFYKLFITPYIFINEYYYFKNINIKVKSYSYPQI